jgi:hypothetical protein
MHSFVTRDESVREGETRHEASLLQKMETKEPERKPSTAAKTRRREIHLSA